MNDLERVLTEISVAVEAAGGDLDEIERRLTDGYAHALELEAERSRLEKRLTQEVHRGAEGNGAELTSLAGRLDSAAEDLARLRGALADLRRHADAVRAASI
jgi:chromosome segregation ATPase